MRVRGIVPGLVGVTALIAVGACGSDSDGGGDGGSLSGRTITLYNGQHESTTEALVAAFTERTGITVETRSGSDPELANQLVAEGSASPADVIYTENSPALNLLDGKGLLADLDAKTRAQVPDQYAGDHWVGVAGRSTVLVYNPDLLGEDELPASLMDLADSSWRGQFGIAPGGADFQAIVSAVVAEEGADQGAAWLDGLKDNAEIFDGNGAILRAVNAGDLPAGIIYHYYWYRDQAESGANSDTAKLHFFGGGDPGGFISVSGAGVLASSEHKEAAESFVNFLSGTDGQTVLADSDDLEYPLGGGVEPNPALKPFDELEPPDLAPADLGDGTRTVDMMRDAGLL